MKKNYFLLLFISLAFFVNAQITVNHLGTYATGVFDQGATEIAKYDPVSMRLFSTNGANNKVDIIDVSNPNNPSLITSIDITPYGGGANSVAVFDEILVAAVENVDKQANGRAVFFDTNGNYLADVEVGALPDMVTFSPDGNYVLTANEGEPNDDYDNDPHGSVSIIDISGGLAGLSASNVSTIDFSGFSMADFNASVRIFGKNGTATIAEDIEPEYIAVDKNSQFAYVALQENNAIAKIDIQNAVITEVVGLGFKNHSLASNPFDASDKDNKINITTWPVFGMYQPDALKAFEHNGNTYLISANEGDSRDYNGYSEVKRVKNLTLDPIAFPNASVLLDKNLGRLNVTSANGDIDNDGDYDALYSFGARSFSIWDANGNLVFDSGDDIEQQIAADANFSVYFNSTNDNNNSFDKRSDDKGPEPEAVEVVIRDAVSYAFIGLERIGGFVIYNISDINNPVFVDYINNRDFTQNATTPQAGDLAPEDINFIPSVFSPNGNDLLVVSNEVSGTISIFQVNGLPVITLPTVTTNAVSMIESWTALSGGVVTSAGTSPVTEYGICWNTTGNPTIYDNKTIDGSGIGAFISAMNGLSSSTTYYVRAYATSEVGTAYGAEETFATLPPPVPLSDNGIYVVMFLMAGFTIFTVRRRFI